MCFFLCNAIQLNQPRLSLSHEYLLEGFTNDFVKAYYNYMFDIAMMLGANETSVEVELKEVMELEIQLANVSSRAQTMESSLFINSMHFVC